MFMRNFGHPVQMMYGPETGTGAGDAGTGAGSGGSAGAGGASGSGATGNQGGGGTGVGGDQGGAITAPWGADPNTPWKIADKPWYEHLPPGPSRDLMAAKAYANPQVFADAYYNINKMVSQNGQDIVLPKDDAPPEAWNDFYKKIGRPETKDGYPDFKMPEGVQADPKMVDLGKTIAFELGLDPKRGQLLADKWNEFATEQNRQGIDAMKATNEAEIAALQKAAGADWETQIANGKRAAATLGVDTALMDKLEGHIGAASVLSLFMKIGSATGEGTLKGGGSGGDANNPETMTPQQAAAKITTLQNDANFQASFTNNQHDGHKAALALMEKLYQRAGNLAPGG